MATVAADLKVYLQADAAIARAVGSKVHVNKVPHKPAPPYVWFGRTGDETFDALDDAQGTTPNIFRFALECIGRDEPEAEAMIALVKARCHKALKATMGTRTATLFCEDQSNDYEYKAGAGDLAHHICAVQVEVFL